MSSFASLMFAKLANESFLTTTGMSSKRPSARILTREAQMYVQYVNETVKLLPRYCACANRCTAPLLIWGIIITERNKPRL